MMLARRPSFQIRTLMITVIIATLLLWGAVMVPRSYRYYRLVRLYGDQERGRLSIASREGRRAASDSEMAAFHEECVEYFGSMTRKYRNAMWHPWESVAPDPYAPGADPAWRR